MDTCMTPKCKKRLLENDPHTPSPKKARKDLSLEEKLTLIADLEKTSKLTEKEPSEKYGIGRTTVSDILKKKIFLLITTQTNMQEIRKGLRFRQNTQN